MFNGVLRVLGFSSVTVLLMGCGGAGDDNGLCMALGPDKSDWQGCSNATLDFAVHPCQREVTKACGASTTDSACATERMAACATNYYLRNYAPETLSPCNPERSVLPINATLKLALYRYSNVSDTSTVLHSQGLQRFFEPYNLTMITDTIAGSERIRYALAGSESELNQALIEAGIPADATSLTAEQQELAAKVIGNVMFAPTKAFFARHALPAERKVNIVVIDQIASPGIVDLMGMEGTIVGLGLSSTLIARLAADDPQGGSLSSMLQMDGDFTPTLFVGNSDISLLSDNFAFVVAHELGHTLGLEHVDEDGNLMQQGGPDYCLQWLSQDQIDSMGPFMNVTSDAGNALGKVSTFPRKILDKLMVKRRRSLGAE